MVLLTIFATGGCAKEEPETKTVYVPVPVNEPAGLPEDDSLMRAEIVCNAAGGNLYGGTCSYPGGVPEGGVPCDSVLEQRNEFNCGG